MSKLQIMQNKLLKLLLKWDRRTPTDLVHKELSLLKIDDIHIAKVLSFVNECRSCRVPDMFVNYYEIRETGLNLRNQLLYKKSFHKQLSNALIRTYN